MLSRLVIAFPPNSKHLLITWLQSPSTVILETKKIKFVTVSTVSPSTSVLAWRILWTEEPGGLQSMGHKELNTTEAT